MSSPTTPTAVVFDLGGVLIDWDPRYLYRKLMAEDEIDPFLDEIGFRAWNHAQDFGGSWGPAVEALAARHPHRRELIAAYPDRFPETLGGPIEGTVAMLEELHAAGTRLVALTNWSTETFPHARAAFGFLDASRASSSPGARASASPTRRCSTSCSTATPWSRPGPSSSTTRRPTSPRQPRPASALPFTDPERLRADLSRLGLLDGAGSG